MTIHVEAQYLGQSEDGFHYQSSYQLIVKRRWNGRVTAVATHGYLFKPVDGMIRSYESFEAFLHDWSIIRVADSKYAQ